MANDLLNELNRNLANAEEIGNVEWAAALKKRIAELEKPVKAPVKAPVESKSVSAEPAVNKATAKKTAKKVSKK